MSLTTTVTETENIHSLRLTRYDKRDIMDNAPEVVVDMALAQLQKHGVELIEWRAPLYRRMHVPIIIKNFSYLIDDDKLDKATDILSDIGLPRISPSTFALRVGGDFESKAIMHCITHSTLPGYVQHLAIYPISFSSLSWSDVTKQSPCWNLPTQNCKSIFVASQPAVYASLIRMVSKYPRVCRMATLLHSDLSELIGYNLLDLQDGFVDMDELSEEEKWEIHSKSELAAENVLSWNWEQCLRPGEWWIRDALYAIVRGSGSIEDLPCKS